MITGKILHCPQCGEPYEFAAYKVGDQSICPPCHAKLTARISENRERRYPVNGFEYEMIMK